MSSEIVCGPSVPSGQDEMEALFDQGEISLAASAGWRVRWTGQVRPGTKDLNRAFVFFAGTDTDDALDVKDGNFTVAYLPGTSGGRDRRNDGVELFDRGQNIQLEASDVIGVVNTTAVSELFTALETKALYLGECKKADVDLGECVTDGLKTREADDSFNFLHGGLDYLKTVT